MSEFTPEQLDRLEDALESLAPDADIDGLDLSPELMESARAYRRVLQVVDTHLEEEAPSEGVLDDVLAAAYAAVEAPTQTGDADAAGATTRKGGWRRWWMPLLATGGVAAAILFLVRPEQATNEDALALEGVVTAPAPGEAAPASGAATSVDLARDKDGLDAQAGAGEADRAAMAPAPEREEPAPPSAGLEEAPAPSDAPNPGANDLLDPFGAVPTSSKSASKPTAPSSAPAPARKRAKRKSAAAPRKTKYGEKDVSTADLFDGGATAAKLGQAADDEAKSDTFEEALQSKADPKEQWLDALTRAHAARRRGSCSTAMKLYADLSKSSTAMKSRLAEVFAGQGLCHERRGAQSAAAAAFGRARALNGAITKWIDAERAVMPKP